LRAIRNIAAEGNSYSTIVDNVVGDSPEQALAASKQRNLCPFTREHYSDVSADAAGRAGYDYITAFEETSPASRASR
jgi:hypothetical protein